VDPENVFGFVLFCFLSSFFDFLQVCLEPSQFLPALKLLSLPAILQLGGALP
jgi:hypothetical protein